MMFVAALIAAALFLHEVQEIASYHRLHSDTVDVDGSTGWSNMVSASVSSTGNGSLSEFDAAVEYSSQIFARVSKGLSLVSVSVGANAGAKASADMPCTSNSLRFTAWLSMAVRRDVEDVI